MKIYRTLQDFHSLPSSPLVLTIGNFDGVHRGHLAVLEELKRRAQALQGTSAVITFANHPSQVLRPDKPIALLCTLEHRLKLLKEAGVDHLVVIPFTREFSQQTAREFIHGVRERCPFRELVLGHDATLGKDRQGTRAEMQQIAQQEKYRLDYIEELTIDRKKVSSSTIRSLIQEGKFQEAKRLLGRDFSIYATVVTGQGLGKRIGYPTLNIPVERLCLPPLGVYAVKVLHDGDLLAGVANLGIAPTLRADNKPILEVHLLEGAVAGTTPLEVFFHSYIRREKRFPSVEALKEQIASDVETAARHFTTEAQRHRDAPQ